MRVSPVSASVLLLLAITAFVPTHAVTAPKNAASKNAAAPAKNAAGADAKIDPAARRVIERALAAYRNLRSYSGLMEMSTTTPPGVRWGGESQRAIIAFQKPNRANVTILTEQGLWQSVADGTNTYTVTPLSRTKYIKTAIPAKRRTITGAFGYDNQLMTLGTGWFGNIAAGDERMVWRMLDSYDFETRKSTLQSVRLGKAETVAGVPVDSVIVINIHRGRVTGETEPRVRRSRLLLSFGKRDHLLRRFIMESSGRAGSSNSSEAPIVTVETHSGIVANADLPDSLFQFTPPSVGAVGGEAQAVADGEALHASLNAAREPMHDPRLKVGAAPFPFTAKTLDGKTVSLDDYKGRVVLLDFWATWCGPCIGEIPETRVVYNKYKAQGFDILGISLDDETMQRNLPIFLEQKEMPWPQVFDGKGWKNEVAQLYGVKAIPFTVLIGRDGNIAAMDLRGPGLEPAVRTALAQK